MKWLLVSTIGKNPGDEFIRIGLSNVIREIDKSAIGNVVDKETNGIFKPIDFDRCIWAGMPVFWSLNHNSSWSSVPWWKVMTRGWVSENKDNFCVIGAGSFQDATNIFRGVDKERLHSEAELLKERSHTVVVRDEIANLITGIDFPVQVCPAYLATYGMEKTDSIKGCNLMPLGGHYGEFSPNECEQWKNKVTPIAKILLENGFKFFAHNKNEHNTAKGMGWSDDNIISYRGDSIEFLKHYRNVDKFFGNRVHGCIVSQANGADVLSCGFDTRQSAVILSGAKALLPSMIDLGKIEAWGKEEPKTMDSMVDDVFDYYAGLLDTFKGNKDV